MPTQILDQLKALRAGVAEALQKDPRYLTLVALDKSISEISSVLSASGLIPAAEVPPLMPASLNPLAPVATPSAASVPTPAKPAVPAAAPTSTAVAAPLAALPAEPPAPPAKPKDGEAAAPKAPAAKADTLAKPDASTKTAPSGKTDKTGKSDKSDKAAKTDKADPGAKDAPKPADGGKSEKKSILKPLIQAAAALAVGGVAAALAVEANAKSAKPHAEPGKPEKEKPKKSGAADDEGADDGDSDEAPAKPVQKHGSARAGSGAPDGKGKAAGYKSMEARPGAPQYQASLSVKTGKLPNKVDLRSLMTPVEDQGQTNSCVANAVAGAYEYWVKKATKSDENISRLFVYYNARWRDGSQDKDEGSVIQFAMEGLSKFGACTEKSWPFDKRLIVKKPNGDAYKFAAPNRVQDMAQVPLELDAWKQALAEGKPIVFGCLLFDSFDQCTDKGGVVPMPEPDALARGTHSGHSMCAVGYSDTEKVFIIRNSWGSDWGDKGYCYMPYSYLLNPKLNMGDCWVFVPRVPLPPPRDVWSDDETPVTNDGRGVDFKIDTYSITDYEHITIDLFKEICVPFNSVELPDFQEYVSFARLSQWSKLEQFDVETFLSSTSVEETTEEHSEEFVSTDETETNSEEETSED